MTDVLVLAVLIGFFVLCVLYVQWCDRIIETDADPAEPAQPAEPVLANDGGSPL